MERNDVIMTKSLSNRALTSASETIETGDPALDRGGVVFVARCASCHRAGSETVPLALASALTGPQPENFLKVVIDGVTPTENAYFIRPMPGFPQLTRGELRDLTVFSRHRFADAPAWTGIDAALDNIIE